MGVTEYVLLVVVIVVPLVIAGAVTFWSLKQVQYRPKKRRPGRPAAPAAGAAAPPDAGSESTPR